MKKSCLKSENLLLVSDDPILKVNETFYASSPIIYFWKEISTYFNKVTIFFPLKEQNKSFSIFQHVFKEDTNFRVYNRTFYISKKEALKNPKLIWDIKNLYNLIFESDIIVFKVPSLLFVPFYFLLKDKKLNKKVFIIYIAGDLVERNKNNYFYEKLANIYDNFLRNVRKSYRNVILLSTGKRLAQKYSAGLFDISLIKEKDIEECEKKKNINEEKYTLLFVGRIDKNKGLDILISAIEKLISRYPKNIKLKIAGDGKEKENLKKLVEKKNLRKYIEFIGSIPYGKELKQVFCNSDIFILPSRSEGIPKVLYEAMAFKLPIISTKVGGIPTLTNDGKAAILIEPDNPEVLANAIINLIENFNLYNTLKEEGLKIAKEQTLERKVSQFIDIIKENVKCAE